MYKYEHTVAKKFVQVDSDKRVAGEVNLSIPLYMYKFIYLISIYEIISNYLLTPQIK